MTSAAYALAFVTPVLLVIGALGGSWWTLLPIAYVYLFLPLFDEARGDGEDTGPGPLPRWQADLPLLLWLPVQLLATGWILQRTSSGADTPLETAGLAVSLGVMAGAGGINVAHELMHRHAGWARAIAEGLMTVVSYPHFCIEHVHGHHRNVATPLDPATSRVGETVYRFYPRSLVGGLRSAWHLEGERMARTGLQAFSLADRRLRMPLLLLALHAAVGAVFGLRGWLVFAAHGIVAFTLLELVNYLEHYGLQRGKDASGRYEPVLPRHSWNSNRMLSNGFLFNLARHSDHHHLASRPYDALRSHADAPQLPAGYSAMMLLSLVPPLWFRVMDARVEQQRDRPSA